MPATSPSDAPGAGMRRLNRRNAQFARSLQIAFGAYLRTEIGVRAEPVRAESQSTLAGQDMGADFYAFAQGAGSPLVLKLESQAVFALLELLLGGSLEGLTPPDREITEIERKLLLDLLAVAVAQFDNLWGFGLEPALRPIFDERELRRALPAGEQLLVIPVALKLGERSAELSLRVAAPPAEENNAETASQPVAEPASEERQRRMLERMKPLALSFDVRVEDATLPLRDLFRLKVGQVLVLDHPVDKPLACRINQGPKLYGRVVRSGDWRAFRVVPPPAD